MANIEPTMFTTCKIMIEYFDLKFFNFFLFSILSLPKCSFATNNWSSSVRPCPLVFGFGPLSFWLSFWFAVNIHTNRFDTIWSTLCSPERNIFAWDFGFEKCRITCCRYLQRNFVSKIAIDKQLGQDNRTHYNVCNHSIGGCIFILKSKGNKSGSIDNVFALNPIIVPLSSRRPVCTFAKN